MVKGDYLPKKILWQEAICPICRKEYIYPRGHVKPKTCGDFSCLYAYAMKLVKKRGES